MKYHDFNAKLGLALVSNDDVTCWRFESAEGLTKRDLEQTPVWLLRQGIFVANVIPQGLVIAGYKIGIVPEDWLRKAGRDVWA